MSKKSGDGLGTVIGMLPTPMQSDGDDCGSPKANMTTLTRKIKDLLPTPKVGDYRSGKQRTQLERGRTAGADLNEVIENQSSSPTSVISTAADSGEQLCFPADFRASLSASPGSAEAKRMTVRSGRKCAGLYRRPGPLGLLARTLLASSAWGSTKCWLTWQAKVTKQRRLLLFQLAAWTPRTRGTGSGLLPGILKTPSAVETEGGIMEIRPGCDGHYKLRDQIAGLIPTPSAGDSECCGPHRGKADSVYSTIKMLPTPQGADAERFGGDFARENRPGSGGDDLSTAIRRTPEGRPGKSHGLRLRPAFVEWMMGYPPGWTALPEYPANPRWNERKKRAQRPVEPTASKPSGTRSSRRSPTKSSG